MEQQSNIAENKMPIIGNDSPLSTKVRESFKIWLSNGHAKQYTPALCLACIDKASMYLARRKISSIELWEITNFGLFKSVYDKAINDNLFKVTDKKTHTDFVQVGKAFLKFLKSKPDIDKAPAVDLEPPSQLGTRLTIKEAVIRVLEAEPHGMTAEQIYNKISADKLYSFGAQNPLNVVRVEIDRACVNSNYTVRASEDFFRFEKNENGEKVYFLLSKITADDTAGQSIIAEVEPTDQTSEQTEESSVSDRLVCVFKEVFTKGIGIGYVDFTILKNAFEKKHGETLDFSDEQIKGVIEQNSVRLSGNATRYIHLDNLVATDVLGEIEKYLDEQFESGTERVYAQPLYSMFKDKMGIAMNSDLLMHVIETKYGNKYKANRRSSFIQRAAYAPTTYMSQEIEERVVVFLSQDIVPFAAKEVAEKLPQYPRARIEKALEDADLIIKLAEGKYAHIDYVYIDDNEITSVKGIIAEGIGSDGYKTIDSLYSTICESVPSIIENNEGVGKQNILKAIKYQVRGAYRVASKRLADQYWYVEVFEPLRREGK